MTADIERLVRQAMRDAALSALADDREVPPFPTAGEQSTQRPTRRFAPLMVAAAILTLLAGATVGVAVVTAQRDAPPAIQPGPPTTSAPSPLATPRLALEVTYAPESPVAGTELTFTVRGTGLTAETDGRIDVPVVSFGDGTPDAVPASIDNRCSGDPVPIDDTFTEPHTYTQPGSYQVTVTIESCGLTQTKTLTIDVSAAPVTPRLAVEVTYAPESPVAGTPMTFTVRGTGSTAETDGHIDYPVVSFGDGTPDAGPGSIDPTCSGDPKPIDDTFTVPHTYSQPGSYQVTVTIESCGLTQTQPVTIEVG